MGLPTTRDLTIDGTTPVPSSLINKVQDCIIGQKVPLHWRWFSLGRGVQESNIGFTDPGGTYDGGVWDTANGGTFIGTPFAGLPVGTTIYDFSAVIRGTGGAQTVQVLLELSAIIGGGGTVITSVSAVNPANARTRYSAAAFTPYTLIDGDTLQVKTLSHITQTGVIAVGLQIGRL